MIDELFQWQDLEIRLSQTFSPASPIVRNDFFRGRHAAMRRLIDVINQSGQHAVIYGERGVGKTSLANVLSPFIERIAGEDLAAARVNCARETAYADIWRALFDQIGLPANSEYGDLAPYDVFNALRRDDRKIILIVDEFDRIEDPDIDAMFADTIKALSDFNVDATLILAGVADDVDDLIAEHESVNRCLIQIRLPRMTMDELSEIITKGIALVGMEISDEAVKRICAVSLGLPHYAHALGLAAGRAAIDDHRRAVETRDVDSAIGTLTRESQQTILQRFDMATASPRRQNLYFQVLLACALASTDQLGYFRASDVREPYSRIMGRDRTISSFSRHIHGLCGEDRGAVLQRFGQSHSYRFRFSDPMMQPYVLMRGLERGLVRMDDLPAIAQGA